MSAGVAILDPANKLPSASDLFHEHPAHVYDRQRTCSSTPAPSTPTATRYRGNGRMSHTGRRNRGGSRRSGADGQDGDDSDDDSEAERKRRLRCMLDHRSRRTLKNSLDDMQEKLKSGGLLKQRAQHDVEAPSKMKELFRLHSMKRPAGSRWMTRDFPTEMWEFDFEQYLSEVAFDEFHKIHRSLLQMEAPKPNPDERQDINRYMEDRLFQDIELGLVKRCAYFDRCRNEWAPDEIHQPLRMDIRLQVLIERMRDYMSGFPPEVIDIKKIKTELCPSNEETVREIGVLVDNLLSRILEAIQKKLGGTGSDDYEDMMMKIAGRPHNTRTYSRWLTQGAGRDAVENCKWGWWARRVATLKLLARASKNPGMFSCEYQLFEGIDRPGSVTLVLLVGPNQEPRAMKEISPELLDDRVWRCCVDTDNGSVQYQRSVVRRVEMDDGSHQEGVFMVSMDKEILGLLEGGRKCLMLDDEDDSDGTEETLDIKEVDHDVPETSDIPNAQAHGTILSRLLGLLGF